MKYALLVVEYAADDTAAEQAAIMNFLRSARQKLGRTSKATMLNSFCWLCPLEHGLHDLNALVSEAKERGCTTRTLFFDQPPQFVVTQP